ncbi:MAG: phosphatidylserine decarboxylase [Clostridia bacterium]|nr:phosphatidylserine decarboxylase [Clostridia bacterium]
MRPIVTKETSAPAPSVRFLYNTRFGGAVLRLLTRRWISKLAGAFLDSVLSRGLIKGYIRRNGIDMSQFEEEKYKSFNAFFTRRIRAGLRPFAIENAEFPSPCDGKISAYRVDEGGRYEIKGFPYTVESLLKNSELAKKYEGGLCIVLRLAVEDYHRYFYLDDCEKGENVFLKGRLHTVQPYALEKRRVFTENCREYTVLHTANFGDVTQVEVGAMMVGRIVNNHGAGAFKRGEEKGRFEFGGSTIVLLVEKDKVSLDEEFFVNTANGDETVVRCGERIGVANI